MRIEASALRIADVVRVPGYGEGEVARRQEAGAEVRVWFRGREDDEKPSMVFDATSAVEVARPGDLFRFKPPLVPRQRQIVDALTPLGWRFHEGELGGADHLHDAIDMTRVEFQGDRVVAFVRIKTADGWEWPTSGLVLGTLDDFAADFTNQINKLESTSLLAQWEREADDRSRPKAPVPNTDALPRPVTGKPVIVRYSMTEGVLLCGDTRTHKDVIKKLATPYRFRYSKRLPQGCAWYVQRTRGTVQEREKLEAVVAVLRARGVPVELDYVGPDSAMASPVAEQHGPKPVATKPVLRTVAVEPEPTPDAEPETRGRGRPADRQRQAEKLREIAARMIADADETIGADRKENTRRRAGIASNIRGRAYSAKVIAGALALAADEVERGELVYIARLSTRPQIDDLEHALIMARHERRRQTGQRLEGAEPEIADIHHARFTGVEVWKDTLRSLMVHAGNRVDASKRKRMRPLAEGEDKPIELIGNDVELLRAFLIRDEQGKVPHPVEIVGDKVKRYDRLARLGIRDTASLRAALLEYLGCCRGHQKRQADDPLAAAKRELQFAKIPGFYPTPRALAERMVSLAAIEPGMRVLEPSAGSGSIAMAIREQHPDAVLDVIEVQPRLRGLLQAQGFSPIADDFMAFSPDGVLYDRILMNPPFERWQDAQHISQALELLAPGGRLIAIAGGSFTTRDDWGTRELRDQIRELGGRIEKLPEKSFAESGTDVHTVLVVVDAPARKVVKSRPALAVVPVVAAEPAAADCGCKHAEPEPDAAPVVVAAAAKPKPATKPKPVVAEPKPEATKPKPDAAKPKPDAAKPKPVVVRDPIVTTPKGPIDPSVIREEWTAAEARRRAQKIWSNIPKTSCFEVRDGDDDSVTLCPAYQLTPIGNCPPMKRETPSVGVCEPGESVEFFARGTDNKGIVGAKAEGLARLARARDRRATAGEFELGLLPAGDDFDALQTYLDRLVPSRLVYEPGAPFVAIDVRPEPPKIVTPGGERLDLWTTDPIPPGSKLEPRVHTDRPMALVEFVELLGSEALLAYRGIVDAEVLRKVVNLSTGEERKKLAARGGSIADVRHAVLGDHSVYWMRSPSGSRVYGPITAAGEPLNRRQAAEFAATFGNAASIDLPSGWDPSLTVAVAMQFKGHPVWLAWNPETWATQIRQGANGEWTERERLPPTPTWDDKKGYADFTHVTTRTMLDQLEEARPGVRFRVSGPWLGVLWPSDFGKRVDFDPPTGGVLDLDEIRARYVDQLEFSRTHASPLQVKWAQLEAARLKWAERRLKDEQRAARQAEQADKPKREPKPKPEPKPKREPKPEPKTEKVAEPRPKLAVVPDVDHDRDQEQPMTSKGAKKEAAKAKPKKKAGAKKAAASKPEKAASKPEKAASKPEKAASKKGAAKKAASKPAAKKATAKKATAKKAAASKPSPAPKVIEPKTTSPACEASDDSCPPELDAWRGRVRVGDRVRFRKNSSIAGVLGIRTDRVFEVRCTVCRDGKRFVVLDLGLGSANDVALPVGQFAVVERTDAAMPDDVRECVAKLAKLDGELAPGTRRLVAKLARGR